MAIGHDAEDSDSGFCSYSCRCIQGIGSLRGLCPHIHVDGHPETVGDRASSRCSPGVHLWLSEGRNSLSLRSSLVRHSHLAMTYGDLCESNISSGAGE